MWCGNVPEKDSQHLCKTCTCTEAGGALIFRLVSRYSDTDAVRWVLMIAE